MSAAGRARQGAGERLDQILVDRGLAQSREQAQRWIRAGRVAVAGRTETKPGHRFPPDSPVALTGSDRYVSRGGLKLEEALARFGVAVEGAVCLDVGASTGGFTDCLLQHGAARVYAVDVGRGQLHWKLRNDPRVVVKEGLNARHLRPDDLPEVVDVAVVDVSFISLRKVLRAVAGLVRPGGTIVTLIKPQFEAGRSEVGRGGVVRDEGVRRRVVESVREFGVGELALEWRGACESPLRGPAGNVEFLACWRRQ